MLYKSSATFSIHPTPIQQVLNRFVPIHPSSHRRSREVSKSFMAALQINCLQSSSSSRPRFHGSLHPSSNFRPQSIYLKKLPSKITFENLNLRQDRISTMDAAINEDKELVAKLLAIADAVADRANMHSIIGSQRNNWNHLLTNSINSISLMGSLMAGLSAIPATAAGVPQLASLKLAAFVLFGTATAMMAVVNKFQPSQLAEEQRKATWMWKQLERSIQDGLSLRPPTEADIKDSMNKVLALEKAYPLPLLPGMLEKFPDKVEPSRWWPELRRKPAESHQESGNGWNEELEQEMKGLLKVLKLKDEEEYIRLGETVLRANKILAAAGPVLGGVATIGAGLIDTPVAGPAAAVLAVAGGSLAAVVNSVEHAGQVGMLFELLRNNAGFYRWLREEIEFNLGEEDVEKRENGEVLKLKVALQLGRSLSEFRDFAQYASPACRDEDIKEHAGKLF